MTAITYTAARGMQATGVAITADANINVTSSGSPIASAFNSVNSPASDLSAFTDSYWILSSGFANTENNGWFQIDGAPTLQQIALTYESALTMVAEAAANDITLTEYYRGVGQSYQIETNSMPQTLVGDQGIRTQSISLSGKRETIFHRRTVGYAVRTGVIDGDLAFGQWREFFASVMGGEAFTIDLYGSIASPVDPVTAYLDGDPVYQRIENFSKYFINFNIEL